MKVFHLLKFFQLKGPSCGQRYALESGVVTINGNVARPGTIVRNGDRIE